jgi:nicotinamidase-related amidase
MAQDKGTLHPYILVFKDVAPGDSPDTIQTKVQATLQAAVTKLREEPAPWAAAEDAPPPPPAGSAGNPVVHMAAAAAPEVSVG